MNGEKGSSPAVAINMPNFSIQSYFKSVSSCFLLSSLTLKGSIFKVEAGVSTGGEGLMLAHPEQPCSQAGQLAAAIGAWHGAQPGWVTAGDPELCPRSPLHPSCTLTLL